ncbi:hypothetical protein Peur_016781 [Populus x canadensis]
MKVTEMWTSNNRIVNQRMTTETISRPLHLFYLCSFERKRLNPSLIPLTELRL